MDHGTQAWIFDLDGTIVRTQQEFHAPAEAAVLARRGVIVDPHAISERFSGVHTLEVFRELAPECDAQVLLGEKWRHMKRMLMTRSVEPVRYAAHVIQQLHDRKIPMAIASASPLFWIVMCLSYVRLAPYFEHYVSVDEVARGKPEPDVFLLAAKRLGYDPKDCVAVEDGKAGVRAAVAASMRTYWLTQGTETIPGATTIRSLSELVCFMK